MTVDEFQLPLERYLHAHVKGLTGALHIRPVGGAGQSNPTYFVEVADRRFVMRRQPDGHLLPSAHAIDREYRVMTALKHSALPVPSTVLYCESPEIVGTPFYLMERLDGRIFGDAALPGMAPSERRAIYLEMARVMALLHNLSTSTLGLDDYGKVGNYFQRQVSRWQQQWLSSKTHENRALDTLIEWLSHNVPDDDVRALVHGDFKLNNLMFHPVEPRIIAVLDWELSTLGHPLADVAFNCAAWRAMPDEFGGIRGLDLGALGIPTESEYVAHYRESGGDPSGLSPFHFAFSFMRWAVIFEGIAARARHGNAVNSRAQAVGALATPMALRGLEVLQ